MVLKENTKIKAKAEKSYRFDDLLFKDFSWTFQGHLTIFKESISTGTMSQFFHSHSKKEIPVSANNVVQPKDGIVLNHSFSFSSIVNAISSLTF